MHVLWLAFLETPRAYRAHNAQLLLRVVFKVIVQRKSFAVWFHFWKEPTNFGLGNTLNVTLPYKVYQNTEIYPFAHFHTFFSAVTLPTEFNNYEVYDL